jgi:hypothetical protein
MIRKTRHGGSRGNNVLHDAAALRRQHFARCVLPGIFGTPTSRHTGHETFSAHHQALSLPRPVVALLLALAARRLVGRARECDHFVDGSSARATKSRTYLHIDLWTRWVVYLQAPGK